MMYKIDTRGGGGPKIVLEEITGRGGPKIVNQDGPNIYVQRTLFDMYLLTTVT